MLEYSFSVKHDGCWTTDIADEFPDFSATILYSHAFSDTSSTIIEVENVDAATVEDIVAWMAAHPVISAADLVDHHDETGLISLQTDYSESDTEPIGIVFREQSCVPLSPAEVHDGFEHCNFLMMDKEQVRSTYEELREYGQVELKSLSELDVHYHAADLAAVSQAVSSLSARQRQVLKRAIELGYYDVPQGCTIEDIAAEDSVTMSTVAEHLRHAERHVFDSIEPLLTSEDG